MRILILANNDVGLYKFRKELIEELTKQNEVYICLPDGEFRSKLEELGSHFISSTFLERRGKNPVKEIKLLSFYDKIIQECHPDIVFTYTIKPNVYGGMVCARRNIPYVANVTGLGTAIENGGIMQKITLTLYQAGLAGAQKVFFQNAENRDFMLKHGIVNRAYDVLPGSGVNLEEYHVLEYPRKETIDFLFIARVMKAKGIDQYLEMAEYIRERYPKTRFHVCGFCEEDYKEKLEELQRKEIIIYHGQVEDMMTMYENSSCIIHPTYHEGMSNVLLESCACARPVIATDIPGCRECVKDGENGFLVKVGDSKDLIKKVENFLSLSIEKREKMGLAGRKLVEKKFDRRIVVEKYMEELEKAIRKENAES